MQSRGGVGIINIADVSDRNGQVVGVAYVQEGDELLVITQQGMILRMQTNDVRADRPRHAGREADRHRRRRPGRLDRAAGRERRTKTTEYVTRFPDAGLDASAETPAFRRSSPRRWLSLTLTGCSGGPEQPILTQFFTASRLRGQHLA